MSKFPYYEISAGQLIEFQRILAEAGFTPREVESIIKEPKLAKKMLQSIRATKPNNFPQFDQFLKDRSYQLAERRRLNRELPKSLRVSDSLFNNVDTTSDHYQMMEDCEILLVGLGDFKKTQKSIRELTKLTHGIWLSSQFQEDENKFCLHETAADYFYAKPDFYWLRINFMANWEPKDGRSVDQIWLKSAGTKLNVGSLGDAGFALQDSELRKKQNGEDIPYFDHADIEVKASGDGHSRSPYSRWYSDDRGVDFYSHDSDFVYGFYSAPALVE